MDRSALEILLPGAAGRFVEKLEHYIRMILIAVCGIFPESNIVIVGKIKRMVIENHVFARRRNGFYNLISKRAVSFAVLPEPERRYHCQTNSVSFPSVYRNIYRVHNLRPGHIRNIKSDKSYRRA